jgi:3-hydroxymyristoyl/3-hydroxydecanoyl-(acyl carrier protein) dehydratase
MASFPRAGFEPVSEPGGTDVSLTVKVLANSSCFDGHFDGAPILPGIAHLALVLDACARRFGAPCELTAIGEVRWRRPIRPGDELAIAITGELSDAAVRFSIRRHTEIVSSGSVMIAVAGEPHA